MTVIGFGRWDWGAVVCTVQAGLFVRHVFDEIPERETQLKDNQRKLQTNRKRIEKKIGI